MAPERTKTKTSDRWYTRLLWWRRARVTEEKQGNLPLQLTSLVGRQDEIANVIGAFAETRLVTLTGVGGVGKTRVALQAAADASPQFRDGAWLCELAPMTNPDAVIEFVATSLGIRGRPGQPIIDTLLAYLRTKQLLLVIDNCEHLLAPVARLVDMVGRSCPQVIVLATSREGLGITGERIFSIQPFSLPEPDLSLEFLVGYDGVRLFAERAAEMKAGFEISEDNAGAISFLCRHLDGIPLAIELAAARVRSLTPSELGARLDERFRLLTGGSRTALLRHRTLRGTLDWSYELLTEPQRQTLERLAVFRGGFGLDAAEAVVGDGDLDRGGVDDLLGALVDKSLLVADGDGPKTRYRLLETIGRYAQERLEETRSAHAVRARHAEHFGAVAEQAGPLLRVGGQSIWAPRLARDIADFSAAVTYSVEGDDLEAALRIVAPLAVHGVGIGHAALDWAEQVAALVVPVDEVAEPTRESPVAAAARVVPDAPAGVTLVPPQPPAMEPDAPLEGSISDETEMDEPEPEIGVAAIPGDRPSPLLPRVLAWAAWAATVHGEPVRAATLLAAMEAAQADVDGGPHATLHQPRAAIALVAGRSAEAESEARSWAAHAEAAGDEYELAQALTMLGASLCASGNDEEGIATLEQAVRTARDIGNAAVAAVTLAGAVCKTDPKQARALLEEASARSLELGDRYTYGRALATGARIDARGGDAQAALRAASTAVAEQLSVGDAIGVAASLVAIARLLAQLGRYEAAVTVMSAAGESPDAPISGGLTADRIEELEMHGASMDRASAVAYAREQVAVAVGG